MTIMSKNSSIFIFFTTCALICGIIGYKIIIIKSLSQTPTPTSSLPILIEEPVAKDEDITKAHLPTNENAPSEKLSPTSQEKTPPKPICPKSPLEQIDAWLKPLGISTGLTIGYIPNNLVRLSDYVVTSNTTICLNASAAYRLQLMTQAMKLEKLSIVVSSGYRPASYQERLYIQSESTRDLLINPYPSVAAPGHSEHQLGMVVDVVAKPNYTLADFKNTKEYEWMKENAWEYGFIQSYQEGKETITGYIAEPWHWRYVGLEHAKNIHEQEITTYEYLQQLEEEVEKSTSHEKK